jgi:hypothetical protein
LINNQKMCIISDEIKEVTNTEILIAFNKNTKEQLTVYSNKTMNYKDNNYMILPVPNNVSDKINFVDLTGIEVFSKLDSLFSVTKSMSYDSTRVALGRGVEYHSVGSYDIFVCPNLSTIVENFDINSVVISLLNKYYSNKFTFLLCKLKNGKEYKYHPLGYVHKNQNQNLFIPTKHLHIHQKGDLYEKDYEHWDHHIYVYNYLGSIGFKNQVLIDFNDEIRRVIKNHKDETFFKLLPDDNKPEITSGENVKVVSDIGLPKIPFEHDRVHSINKFVIKNTFLNDDLICSVY